MDPLSIIASSIAVAHAAHEAIKVVRGSRTAGPELLALHNEISDLLVVLEELQVILQQRSEAGIGHPPIAGLSPAVEAARMKLDQVISHLSQWTDGGDSGGIDRPKVRLRALRVGRQASRFREELQNIKDRLFSVLEIVSVSSANRIEIDLKQILLLAGQVAEQNEQFQHYMQSYPGTDRLTSTTGTENNSSASQNGTGASSSAIGSIANVVHEHSQTFEVGPTRALHHNGNVLFESSQLTAIAAIGIRTAHLPRTACKPWCSCICHDEVKMRTPKLLERLIGSLFIGYSGLPVLTKECNETSCHLRAQPQSYITYYFPQWFLARAASVVMTTTPLAGPVVSLKTQRTVPGDADIFTHAKLGGVDQLKDLFIKGLASPHDVHFESGITALHLAISHRKVEVCKFLLDMNADAFLEDRTQWTAADNAWNLILAGSLPPETDRALRLMFSATECIERRDFSVLHKIVLGLLPNELEQHLQASTADINAKDNNDRTPVSLAAERGDLSVVTTLLRYGADPRIGSNCFATPLHFAGCAKDPCCLQPLIDAGAQVDALTDWGQTPLIYIAAYTKDARHANILLDAHADKNHQDRDGIVPLAWTAITDNHPVAMTLLARSVKIDMASDTDDTALSQCVAANRLEILHELVQRQASPELHLASGETLLHVAAKHASLATLQILQGLNLQRVDRWQRCAGGRTAEEVLHARADFSEEVRSAFDVLLHASRRFGHGSTVMASDSESDTDSAEVWEDAWEGQE